MATVAFEEKPLENSWEANLVPQPEEAGFVSFKMVSAGREMVVRMPKEDWLVFVKAMPKERSFLSREGMEKSLSSMRTFYTEYQDKMFEHIEAGELYRLNDDMDKLIETRGKISMLQILLGEMNKEEGVKQE